MSEIKIAPERKLTDRDLRRVFWRSCMLDSSWNYERQQNIGYSFGIVPVIEKVYEPGSEKQKRAYARSLDFMAITPQLSTLLMGIDAPWRRRTLRTMSSMILPSPLSRPRLWARSPASATP